MKFFFPDSHDLVDPSFDFDEETRSENRVRHRDDVYAHEIFAKPPYDGVLVSKAIVDGIAGAAGKYTVAQRHRLMRVGVRKFFRLESSQLETMGDCGAFSYVREKYPPYSVDDVIDFYEGCNFDYGMSIDHVILGYRDEKRQPSLPYLDRTPDDWRERQQITLTLAQEFLRRHSARKSPFIPLGVTQGWSPKSYAAAFAELERIGYASIAVGGLVPLKTHEIASVVAAISDVKSPRTGMHLLGVTRVQETPRFKAWGVTSFDSTSPLRQAFKDARNNYYAQDIAYTAIRVPQVAGNPKLARAIQAGLIAQPEARELEQASLRLLMEYDKGLATLGSALDAVCAYEQLYDSGKSRRELYQKLLQDRPWKDCPCEICSTLGIHVVIFRGAERNRRRGFHNLWVFRQRLNNALGENPNPPSSRVRLEAPDHGTQAIAQ